jgi:phosphatidylglycerophosphate synthase
MKNEVQAGGREIAALRAARHIYIATVRRDGTQSKAVPVWFTVTADNSILIQTERNSWTARRVRSGSPLIVWIGWRDGPALIGVGEPGNEPSLTKPIIDDFPRKYLLARIGFHRPRLERFESGQVIAIKITPTRELPQGFARTPGSPAPRLDEKAVESDDLKEPPSLSPESVTRAQAANILSASRFALAALWMAAFTAGMRESVVLGPIATGAAFSDYIDGPVARWMGHAEGAGRWLDPAADIVFVLTALACEALAGAIPIYMPILITCSFSQYAIDSVAIGGNSEPIKSRLGHWGGIINFALVLMLAWAPPPLWPGRVLREVSPLIAGFYVAAMIERALNYRLVQGLRRHSWHA